MRVRRIVLEFAAYNKRIPKLFGMHPTRKESTIGSSHQIYKFKFKFKFKFKLKLANLQVAQAPHYIPHGSRRGTTLKGNSSTQLIQLLQASKQAKQCLLACLLACSSCTCRPCAARGSSSSTVPRTNKCAICRSASEANLFLFRDGRTDRFLS